MGRLYKESRGRILFFGLILQLWICSSFYPNSSQAFWVVEPTSGLVSPLSVGSQPCLGCEPMCYKLNCSGTKNPTLTFHDPSFRNCCPTPCEARSPWEVASNQAFPTPSSMLKFSHPPLPSPLSWAVVYTWYPVPWNRQSFLHSKTTLAQLKSGMGRWSCTITDGMPGEIKHSQSLDTCNS